MVETVGSDQVSSLTKDLSSFESQIKAAKKISKSDPAVTAAEEHYSRLSELAGKMTVGQTVVDKYTALRTALTTTMKADVKALKAVKAPEETGPVNVGMAGLTKSENAIKLLEKLANGDLKGKLILKNGDGQHADSKLWRFDGKDGSLPTTAHTKGPGGKNEKAALVELKKVFKNAGYL